ncbi:zinc finger protein [Trichonephila clavata]|uniref:Zinc finger protein n=1 Tax=Trichonephila clavata TaxID=2740835 RepID=A0A8X6LHV6_TRICU|nr:zinc finger protein [Trichonephila clavata]
MDYRCDPCNLDFTDIQQYLDHDCKSYVDQSVTQVCKDISMCINAFSLFKSTREGHAGNTPANEEQNKGISNDASVKEKRLILVFLKCNENKSYKETPNEKSALQQRLKNTEYFN